MNVAMNLAMNLAMNVDMFEQLTKIEFFYFKIFLLFCILQIHLHFTYKMANPNPPNPIAIAIANANLVVPVFATIIIDGQTIRVVDGRYSIWSEVNFSWIPYTAGGKSRKRKLSNSFDPEYVNGKPIPEDIDGREPLSQPIYLCGPPSKWEERMKKPLRQTYVVLSSTRKRLVF